MSFFEELQKPSNRSLIIVAVIAGTLAFLFFGQSSLADVFYFMASVLAIAAFVLSKQLKSELEIMRTKINERVEELEFRIDKLEKSKT